MNTSYIGPDELIYNNDGGIHSGGFNINSIMMKNGLSPIITLNSNTNSNTDSNTVSSNIRQQFGGSSGNEINKVSDMFNNLVIPNWSLSYNYKNGGSFVERNNKYEDDDVIEDELHDKLLNLVKMHENEMKEIVSKKKTRKGLKNPNSITKKRNRNKQ
jgi:translation elongation factor P/translation initiation factor 5A